MAAPAQRTARAVARLSGIRTVAITYAGRVRGCSALPPEFDAGDLHSESLEQIWNDVDRFAYSTRFDASRLTGACANCPFGWLCRAGCTTMAWWVTGTIYDNPYCLRRQIAPRRPEVLAKQVTPARGAAMKRSVASASSDEIRVVEEATSESGRPVGASRLAQVKLAAAELELTTACPCRCITCGSAAGAVRSGELDSREWIGVIEQLAELGCERVSLLGGEPLAAPSWEQVATAAARAGMRVELITSGVGLTADVARQVGAAGVASVTVSVDGTEAAHNAQRRVVDGYRMALEAIRTLDRAGTRVGVTTQVNACSLPTLEAMAPELQAAGALGWQLQLTLPTGRAARASGLVLPDRQMSNVLSTVRRLVRRRGLRPTITDNLGYWTADDMRLRSPQGGPPRAWLRCFAGLRHVGIRSDGRVTGCLALPDRMVEGNLRSEPLAQIWNDPARFVLTRRFCCDLAGACAACRFAELCRGGCTAAALAFHGRAGISSHCWRLHESAATTSEPKDPPDEQPLCVP